MIACLLSVCATRYHGSVIRHFNETGSRALMQVACPHCRQVLEFADRRPAFCGFCGGSLANAIDHLASTQAYVEVACQEAPTQMYLGGDAGSGSSFAPAGHSDSVGDYKLLRQLGQGGMGVVYEAEQGATGRRVALKLLSPKLAHTDESMERFVREGRLAAAFSHPRSTFVFGAGQHAGQPYITMELMPGRTLNDVCRDEGPLPVNRAVDYILDVIEGLEAAHAAGIIHRDVKPSNCFLDSDGRVKVGDFGLSKSLVSDADLTRTGAFLGTPLFAAPEQVHGLRRTRAGRPSQAGRAS
jgi:serine/threonine protein kinase/phage FluMu protein Com